MEGFRIGSGVPYSGSGVKYELLGPNLRVSGRTEYKAGLLFPISNNVEDFLSQLGKFLVDGVDLQEGLRATYLVLVPPLDNGIPESFELLGGWLRTWLVLALRHG